MAICPNGHDSASDDFCDVCGMRIAASPSPGSAGNTGGTGSMGSGGYGHAFAIAVRGAWGMADWASLERLIDNVVAMPGLDAGRVAITGVSYGGYLAMWAATRSDRFSAVISENGISNLLAEWGTGRDGDAWLTAELGADAYGLYCRRVPMLVPFLPRR